MPKHQETYFLSNDIPYLFVIMAAKFHFFFINNIYCFQKAKRICHQLQLCHKHPVILLLIYAEGISQQVFARRSENKMAIATT